MLIGDIVSLNARKTPSRPAITAGDRVISYGELHERMNRVANAVADLCDRGDRVAVLAENIPEYVELYYGVPSAGRTLVLLNYRLHPREWAWILRNSGCKVLVVEHKFVEPLVSHVQEVEHLPELVVVGGEAGSGMRPYDEFLAGSRPDVPAPPPDADDTAWLLYTSGTTGFPKGAMLSHRNLLASVTNTVIEYEFQPDERTLVAFPMCHVAGYQVLVTHLRGGEVVLSPTFRPETWLRLVEHHGITGTGLAPTMLKSILDHPDVDRYDLSSLTGIGYGSSAVPVDVLRRGIERFGPIFYSGFGMTEAAGNALILSRADHARAVTGAEHLLQSCGRPMALTDARVVDGQMETCAPGEVGELAIRGDQVFAGYLANAAATDSAFDGGWFRTGDLARVDDDGYFYIVDRLKDMIISGGENVYSREVENVLATHPAVSEVAVFGVPDARWGEAVTAAVMLGPASTADEHDIIRFAKAHLAGFKSPRRVVFVDDMPRTVTGKIVKTALRERLLEDRD